MPIPTTVYIETGRFPTVYIQVNKWSGTIGASQIVPYPALQAGGANASDGVLTCTISYPDATTANPTIADLGNGLYGVVLDSAHTGTAGVAVVRFNTAAPNAVETDQYTLVNISPSWISKISTNLDAQVSSRLATSGYTTPPTTSAIASAAWNELLTGHTTANSAGKVLQQLLSQNIPDVLTNAVPGSYASGTAGYAISKLLGAGSSNPIIVTTPLAYGGSLSLIEGDDYTGISWQDTSSYWPDLTGATSVEFIVKSPDGILSDFNQDVTVSGAGSSSQSLSLDLTHSQTIALANMQRAGATNFRIVATLSSGAIKTLVAATFTFI